jgi:hypothetical protein
VFLDRFKEALEDCKLSDLGYTRDPFTWRNNRQKSESYIRERLDRAVPMEEWCARFPYYKVINGDPRHSDHRSLIIHLDGESIVASKSGDGPFGLRRSGLKRRTAKWW